MKIQLSRRDFLFGAGAGVATGAIVARLEWPAWSRVIRLPGMREPDPCCAPAEYAEHDGWLLTIADKEALRGVR